ncbi:MAG: PD40 domain-containing protein [Deltaproteobacteria bacterium]|nr:PD40 domain-containing protein [Deltaproteobacteria bacterium]
MRIDRLVPCMLLVFVGCGSEQKFVQVDAKLDGPAGDGPEDPDGPTPDGPADGPAGDVVNLTNLTPIAGRVLRADFVTPLFFKPDGTAVAVTANYLGTVDNFEPIVVPLDGSGLIRTVNLDACGICDADHFAWTADGASLYAVGDLGTDGKTDVFKLDPTMANQTPVLAADATTGGTGGDINTVFAVDAGGGVSRIWAVGDWLTDGARVAGGFASDATLPFNTATPPTFVVPGGGRELFDGTGSTVNVFDARGTKVAFVSDITQNNRFDLYIANADGSSPVLLVTGQTNVEITSVSISPDGTKVGYIMDSTANNNGFDLHVVPAAGGVSTQLSPLRVAQATTQDVFFQFEWSADSKFIAFSADLETDGVDSGYVVDTTQAVPVAVVILPAADIGTQTSGAQGTRGKLLFDSANNIYFRARTVTGDDNFKLFKSTPTGTKVTIDLPPRTDATTPDVGAFGISPDGTKLVFSSDSPTVDTYNLFLQAL